MNLSTPVTSLPRIGKAHEKRLKNLGITTVRDLLFHFPRSYEDLTTISSIEDIKEGEQYAVKGTILEIGEITTFKKRFSIVEALLKDDTGTIKILWFSQPYLLASFKKGDSIYIAGSLVRDKRGIYFHVTTYEKDSNDLTHIGRIVPQYPETKGLSSKWLRSVIKPVVETLSIEKDSLPNEIVKEKDLLPFTKALQQIHFPESLESSKKAQKRFAFEEIFNISLFVLTERKKISKIKASMIPFSEIHTKRLVSSLLFKLTDDQKISAFTILKDMEKPRPMNRLLQGDVGSGKTIVAAIAALSSVKAKHQVAFMAPTEILAKQHFKSVGSLLARFKANVGLLTGSTDSFISPKLPNDVIEISRTKLLKMAKEGKLDVLIGTHALIQDKVKFNNLALVILDEQHRFGVKQRKKLLHNSELVPHLLSMTATPIPRTLALSIYGDLDISTIKEMPKGRKEIKTTVVSPKERTATYKFIKKEVNKGRQVFVICPRIEVTDSGAEMKTVKEEYEKLSTKIFPELRIEQLHGKMSSKEKERVMKNMLRGKIDILVATSVVEVGVDIQNASIILIEGADRFGLAQLHQFRGRVGRDKYQSYCFLFTDSTNTKTIQRLKALTDTSNGFELAEQDLLLRGPGDFTGVKQWGLPDFAMQQLTNLELVKEAKESAQALLEKDISLKKHSLLQEMLHDLKEKLHLE